MNTVVKLLTKLLLGIVVMPLLSYGQAGEVSGGGIGIPKDDIVLLEDLEKRNFSCQSTETLLYLNPETNKKLNEILNTLAQSNAYMAYRVRKDLYNPKTSWCFTDAKLIDVTTIDKDSFLVSFDPKVQVAIRDLRSKSPLIYVSRPAFDRLSSNQTILGKAVGKNTTQAVFLLHEILHSFLPIKNIASRNDSLRTMTRGIYDNYVKLKEKALPEQLAKKDLDNTIRATGLLYEFENAEFADAFVKYIKNSSDAAATRLLDFSVKGRSHRNYVDIIVNDFGRADFLVSGTFAEEYFAPQHKKWVYHVPEKYFFPNILAEFSKTTRWLAKHASQYGKYGETDSIKINPPKAEVKLGSCVLVRTLNMMASYVYGRNSIQKTPRISIQYSSQMGYALIPNYGNSPEKALTWSVDHSYQNIDIGNMPSDWVLKKLGYRSQSEKAWGHIRKMLEYLKQGNCNDHAPNLVDHSLSY